MSLLSVKCKLIPHVPHASTADKLSRTVDQFAGACNYALQVARRDNVWNKFALQRAVYRELRERFGLSANLAVRAIARVGKRKGHKAGGFKATSVDYDQRILSVNIAVALPEGQTRLVALPAGQTRLDAASPWKTFRGFQAAHSAGGFAATLASGYGLGSPRGPRCTAGRSMTWVKNCGTKLNGAE